MGERKLDMLKSLFKFSYEIELKGLDEEIAAFEAVLDDESFQFIRDLILEQKPTDSTQQNNHFRKDQDA